MLLLGKTPCGAKASQTNRRPGHRRGGRAMSAHIDNTDKIIFAEVARGLAAATTATRCWHRRCCSAMWTAATTTTSAGARVMHERGSDTGIRTRPERQMLLLGKTACGAKASQTNRRGLRLQAQPGFAAPSCVRRSPAKPPRPYRTRMRRPRSACME